MDTKLLEKLIALVNDNKLDMLEFNGIKIIKSKHESQIITTQSPKFQALTQEEKEAQIDRELFDQ